MIVWLASYPRSGNTFLRVILNSVFNIKTYSIYNDKIGIGKDEKTSEIVGHTLLPQDFNIERFREEKNVYYIKTHNLLDDKVDKKDKVIYIIRDGREATLSFTNHQNTFSLHNKKLIDTIYGDTFVGSWGAHVSSWNPKNRENTLLIKFEELIINPLEFIDRLTIFLKVKSSSNEIPSFDELKKINSKFFRSGKQNSWEKIFSKEEHMSFWLNSYKQMDEYGYDFKKPNDFDELLNDKLNLELINQNNFIINLILKEKEKQIINQTKKNEEKDELIENLDNKIDKLLNYQLITEELYKCKLISPFKKIHSYNKLISFHSNLKGAKW